MDILPLPEEDQCLNWAVTSGPAQLQLHLSSKAGEEPLHCVGSLQVQRQMQLGFLCGSLPVPTDNDAMTSKTASMSEAAIVPAIGLQSERAMAPQYRMLPTQTDLNTFFLSEREPEQILPITSAKAPGGVHELCMAWGNGYHTQPLARKCEALAVSALAGYGDEIDVIAPVDILKKIFKIPYSKGRLSVAVHRVGRTLILNTGPDVEEGEKLVRPKKNQAKERSLFWKFAMQSVRAEACDCPKSQNSEQPASHNIAPKHSCSDDSDDYVDTSLDKHAHVGWQFMVDHNSNKNRNRDSKSLNAGMGGSSMDHKQRVAWSSSNGSSFSTGIESLKKSSLVGEHQRDPDYIQNDSGNHKRQTSEGFLRVLFWQLQEMRMLLGSDLLLFSNEKHVAVSLHLWEIERQVTPLMWLDAWLDNVMASVPELAICYHHNGIVQGYELLKTDDIFLLKGLSEDGTAFFHPHVVQQNALSVLRFLQENCKEDPGTYWLFKNAGEDLVQLFDLSVISKNHSTATPKDEKSESLATPRSRGKGNCSVPLGILLYRLAHRLSLSQDLADRCKCANFFKKCLELLGEQEHLFVRASAHEHVARLILRCHKELGSTLTPFFLESNELNEIGTESPSESVLDQTASSSEALREDADVNILLESASIMESTTSSSHLQPSVMFEDGNYSESQAALHAEETMATDRGADTDNGSAFAISDCIPNAEEPLEAMDRESAPTFPKSLDAEIGSKFTASSPELPKNIIDPVSARLAAVHHVSQAIKALRWQRQLQDVEGKLSSSESTLLGANRYIQLVPVCLYGEIDCVELCDIRECEIGPLMDQKLWQLVLLLGESYLALGQAYKDDAQLKRALKAAELACSVYGSMPQHWRNKGHIRFEQGIEWVQTSTPHFSKSDKPVPITCRTKSTSDTFCQPIFHDSGTGKSTDKGLFWGQAWMLLGDIYIESQRVINENKVPAEREASKYDGLTMAQEVIKEVKRLRKKLGQSKKSCSFCSLVNCSCQSDRASSGNSASSSSNSSGGGGFGTTVRHPRKYCKKTNTNVSAVASADIARISGKTHGSSSVSESLKGNLSGHYLNETTSSLQEKTEDRHTGNSNSKLGTNTDLSTDALKDKDSILKQRTKGDIFSFLQGSVSVDVETNLLAAVDCYDAAVITLKETWQGSEELKSVFRKKGWACNELGRLRLANGDTKGAEAAFHDATDTFKDVKDHTNVVLIYCNLGHGKRASAEALVSEIDTWKSAGLPEHVSKKISDDAKLQYVEALRFYGVAKDEMKLVSEDLDSAKTDLCNEVQTQYAHTYLRLGMFLAREEKNGLSQHLASADGKVSDSQRDQTLQSKKIGMTANDAIREAITLYESLGSFRAQEAAFAQFQLASYHRDCCLTAIQVWGKDYPQISFIQQPKRYLSLAERYWLKALKYYKSKTHPDMFLEILMQRSALYMAMASFSNSFLMLELSLSHLLEGREAWSLSTASSSNHGQEPLKPSSRVASKLSQQLQMLLKRMLAAAQNLQKMSSNRNAVVQTKNRRSVDSNNIGATHSSGQGSDVVKLKEIYRLALMSSDLPDLQRMYDMWVS